MRQSGSYNFPSMDRVVYGRPAADVILEEAERLNAGRVLLIVSGTLNRTTGEIQAIRDRLGERHAATVDDIPQHTTRTSAVAVARAGLDASADLIVAVGGGSVVDIAKITIMCMEHGIVEEEGLDGYERTQGAGHQTAGKNFRWPKARMIAVPTTLSGGEYNAGALVTDTRRKWKQIFYHPAMMPISIILDPAITRHTPERLWLGSGTRSMDHGIEALLSPQGNPLTDAVVAEGIRKLADGLRRTRSDPDDLEARLLCQHGSWLSAFGLQGRVPMGASHAIGHVLGGTFNVPHYLITPALMPAVLRYNLPETQAAQALLASLLGSPGADAADAMEALANALGLPVRLAELGVTPDDYAKIGEVAVKSIFAKSNPRTLSTPEQVVELLSLSRQ